MLDKLRQKTPSFVRMLRMIAFLTLLTGCNYEDPTGSKELQKVQTDFKEIQDTAKVLKSTLKAENIPTATPLPPDNAETSKGSTRSNIMYSLIAFLITAGMGVVTLKRDHNSK